MVESLILLLSRDLEWVERFVRRQLGPVEALENLALRLRPLLYGSSSRPAEMADRPVLVVSRAR